ncbi:DUF7146 domain-containing protein [Palleronia caenipelagi]|uniref:Uncharacterized protein n=1 Tax=Palleronia caenipelagi TaxID=2489174 RepID=A0A547Q7I9_9RHOB|nr:toprim domain-containing protein [Palleronia caenipelagi]TRD22346.1 hypothetical protein FEV53_04610 [Palleronia caenipelagi]
MQSAEVMTKSLGGNWYGSYGVAPCPVCQPERRSDQTALTLGDGHSGLLAHCKKSGCEFGSILAAAGITKDDVCPPDPAVRARRDAERRADIERRARQAHALWCEARPIIGTIAEGYLRDARAIHGPLPDSLRFHPAAWHGATASRYPALVARVDGADGFAVHRTYLGPDGLGKADLTPAKAMLGATAGGAVRLQEGNDRLVVAEGIETALSLACGLLHGPAAIWAALSTSGMTGLRLPNEPGRLVIAPDGDPVGKKAAQTLAERADALGWSVSLLPAPEGSDWNSVIQKRRSGNAHS